MPNPTTENVHVNRPLTNIAVNWIQSQDRFVADEIFPYVGVDKKSNDYFKFDKNDLTRIEAKKLAAGAESAGSGYRVETDTYNADVYAFHKDIADQVRANSDNPLDPDRNATQHVMQNLMMKREKIFGDSFMGSGSSGVWTNSDGSKDWSGDSGSPILDIRNAISTVGEYWADANVAVMGKAVFDELMNHSDFLDRIKYTQEGVVTEELMARVLDLDAIYVSKATHSTAEEGASASMSRCIPDESVLLVHVPDTPQIDVPSAGYTFGWEGLPGADGLNVTIQSMRADLRHSDRIEGQMAFDMKQVAPDLGYLFYDTLTA